MRALKHDCDDALILKMALDGAIMSEICKAVGASNQVVLRRLYHLGAPPVQKKGARLQQEIKALADKGMTLGDISQKIGRNYSHVCRIAREAGIEICKVAAEQPRRFDHDLALAWYRDGRTLREIADHFGVSYQRVSQIAAKAGLKRAVGRPRRPRKAAPVSLAGSFH